MIVFSFISVSSDSIVICVCYHFTSSSDFGFLRKFIYSSMKKKILHSRDHHEIGYISFFAYTHKLNILIRFIIFLIHIRNMASNLENTFISFYYYYYNYHYIFVVSKWNESAKSQKIQFYLFHLQMKLLMRFGFKFIHKRASRWENVVNRWTKLDYD